MEKLGETSIQLKVWEEDFAFVKQLRNGCLSSESFASSADLNSCRETDNPDLQINTEHIKLRVQMGDSAQETPATATRPPKPKLKRKQTV